MENYNKKMLKAIALGYIKEQHKAPKVLTKAEGHMAENLINLAKKLDIPIHKDKELAEILTNLKVNSYIPFEAYKIVAEILKKIKNYNESILDSKKNSEKNI